MHEFSLDRLVRLDKLDSQECQYTTVVPKVDWVKIEGGL